MEKGCNLDLNCTRCDFESLYHALLWCPKADEVWNLAGFNHQFEKKMKCGVY